MAAALAHTIIRAADEAVVVSVDDDDGRRGEDKDRHKGRGGGEEERNRTGGHQAHSLLYGTRDSRSRARPRGEIRALRGRSVDTTLNER